MAVSVSLVMCSISGQTRHFPLFGRRAAADDVHISPRIEHANPATRKRQHRSRLKNHTKPLKVDVDLVLVPVTITDPMNRLVTGLDKENFELFEGKDRRKSATSRVKMLRFRWA